MKDNKSIIDVNKISGVILAGGANSRFNGITKANLILLEKPIIERILDTINGLFNEIIIVTNTPEKFKKYSDYIIISDIIPDKGPLGGIHAALNKCSGDAIFVFAGDMPLISKEIINSQIDYFNRYQYDAIIPEIGNNIEPLHAIYRTSLEIPVFKYLTGNNSLAIREFIRQINVGYMKLEENEKTKRAFININSPDDVKRTEEMMRQVPGSEWKS